MIESKDIQTVFYRQTTQIKLYFLLNYKKFEEKTKKYNFLSFQKSQWFLNGQDLLSKFVLYTQGRIKNFLEGGAYFRKVCHLFLYRSAKLIFRALPNH